MKDSTPSIDISTSRLFSSWLAEHTAALAFTTYQAGKLFLLGLQPNGQLSVFERTFNRCMGLHTTSDANTLYMSTVYQLWRFENSLEPTQAYQGYDRVFVPQMAYTTGDIDVHDIALDRDGRLVFVNTLFSCLSTVSETHSFVPLWKPPSINKLAAEDRCHLNGLAMVEGLPRYVSAVSQSNVNDGWREFRAQGGCVYDIQSNDIIAQGLSMPHSPRWYQNRLWVLNSGEGEFGYIDLTTGRFEVVAFCPGYLRGLAFIGDFAVVGLSLPRHNKTFSGLGLDDKLTSQHAKARCGLQIIDLRRGDVAHSLRIEGVVQELYDTAVLPGVTRPMAVGFKTDEICRMLTIGS